MISSEVGELRHLLVLTYAAAPNSYIPVHMQLLYSAGWIIQSLS